MAFIEQNARLLRDSSHLQQSKSKGHDSAATITIQGSTIVFTQVQDMVKAADMKNRRGKKQWWESFKGLAEELGGRTALVE
jgi:6-phosphofructokinase 1